MAAEAVFGPYRLLELLGQGGMGEVWRAHDTRKDRDIALKVLGAWLGSEEGYARRFRREAALAARLNTPNIIPIHDYGDIDGRLFIEMPLVDGYDLEQLLRREGPLSLQRAVWIIDQVADALDVAHAAGLVHRDVKPSNILITTRRGRDVVYLIDLGIAAAAEATTTMSPRPWSAPSPTSPPNASKAKATTAATSTPWPASCTPALPDRPRSLPPPAPSRWASTSTPTYTSRLPGLPLWFPECPPGSTQ
jgi:serine/threonine protein kinase